MVAGVVATIAFGIGAAVLDLGRFGVPTGATAIAALGGDRHRDHPAARRALERG